MSYSHAITVPNGDTFSGIHFFTCDSCLIEICEMDRRYEDDETHYCLNCAFILKKINSKEYLEMYGMSGSGFGVEFHEGEVVIYFGKPPSKKKNKDHRATKQYRDWRTSVFKRDDYTCQHCKQVGGELNAHHIKLFSKYKKLRHEISNGLTLCVSCHRKIHKKVEVM